MGTIRSFTTSIQQYMVFELLDTIVGAGAYSTAFVLGMELVGPSYRVCSCALLSICFAIGEILVGVIAWQTYSWRIFLLALYLPGFVIILYWWLIPESLRWMIAHQKTEQAMKTLKDVARLNKRKLPEAALENLLQVRNGSMIKYRNVDSILHFSGNLNLRNQHLRDFQVS